MRTRAALFVLLPALLALAGCASQMAQGRTALRQGLYDEAARHFEQSLAENPGSVDALVGLGIARYRLGRYDETVQVLTQAVQEAPRSAPAHLYLALAALQTGDVGLAERHLTTYRGLDVPPRLAAQVDRSLELLRRGPPTEELSRYIAATLDDSAAWASDVQHVERALLDYQTTWGLYPSPYWGPYPYWGPFWYGPYWWGRWRYF
jgi:tetratricopeptide (TPR) repeat protein